MVVLHHLNNQQYLRIVNYLYRNCDTVAFALPNYGASHYFDTYINMKTVITNQLEPKEVDRGNEAFQNYKNNVSPLLEELKESIREVFTATNYFGDIYTYEIETYILTFNEIVLDVLKRYENLSVWRCPDLPEDLLFYNYYKMIAVSVTHEDEITIYDENICGSTSELFNLLDTSNIDYVYY